jgi:hypothetical protein
MGKSEGEREGGSGTFIKLISQTATDRGSKLEILQGVLFKHTEGFDENLFAEEVVVLHAGQ